MLVLAVRDAMLMMDLYAAVVAAAAVVAVAVVTAVA